MLCAGLCDHADAHTIRCSCSTCRSLILPTDGAAPFQNMNTLASTPNDVSDWRTSGSKIPRDGLKMSTAEGSILVKAPIGSVYRQWVRVEDFPKFMTALKNAKRADANHFFITFAHNGQRYEGVLEIMLRVPERRLAWRVLGGKPLSGCLATGVVSFASPSDQSTLVTLKVSSSFDGAVSRRVDKYLHNFKRLIEAT
jgi:uncharacterized membrane protein